MELWNRRIKLARNILLYTAILTVLNVAFLLGNLNLFISYCAALPYYLVLFGKLFDNGYVLGIHNREFVATGMVMAGIVLAVYLVVWWIARSNRRWLQLSLWLLVADLLLLISLAIFAFANPLNCFWEAVFHIAAIWAIANGLQADKKKTAALEALQAESQLQEETPDEPLEAPVL